MGRMFSRMGADPLTGHRMGAETSAGGVLVSPVIVTEDTKSRAMELTPTGATLSRLFTITGIDDPVEAQTFGPAVGSLFPGGLRAVRRVMGVLTDQTVGTPILRLTVEYERERSGGTVFQDRDDFRISGESVNIKQVRTNDDVVHFPVGSKASEDGRTIGLVRSTNRSAEAEGVNVLDPILIYSATRHFDDLTTTQLRQITCLQGRVNSDEFFGFPFGEVLFLGATINDMRDQGVWQVRYEFQIRFNRTGASALQIVLTGDDGTGTAPINVNKEGWQYLTFTLADKGDLAAPQFAHVWSVLERGDFNTLPNIGTSIPWENRPAFPPILSFPPP